MAGTNPSVWARQPHWPLHHHVGQSWKISAGINRAARRKRDRLDGMVALDPGAILPVDRSQSHLSVGSTRRMATFRLNVWGIVIGFLAEQFGIGVARLYDEYSPYTMK